MFRKFADSTLGSWAINGLAVVAFILVLKLLVSQIKQDTGPVGAIKAGINAI